MKKIKTNKQIKILKKTSVEQKKRKERKRELQVIVSNQHYLQDFVSQDCATN